MTWFQARGLERALRLRTVPLRLRTEGWYWNPEAVPEGKPWAPGPFTFQFSTDLWAQEESPPPPHCVGGGIPGHRGWVECPDVSLMPLGAAPSQRVACLGHDRSGTCLAGTVSLALMTSTFPGARAGRASGQGLSCGCRASPHRLGPSDGPGPALGLPSHSAL